MIEATRTTSLQGCRILVVEDEYMIAEEIVGALSDAGAEPLGPVARVDDALRLLASECRIDAALLDVNLYNEVVWPVADELLARHVPLVLATGYDTGGIPPAYAHLPRREKPTTVPELIRALARAMSDHAADGSIDKNSPTDILPAISQATKT